MRRLLFFGDSSSNISSLMLEKTLQLMLVRKDFQLELVCDATRSHTRSNAIRMTEHLLSFYLRKWMNPGQAGEMLVRPRLLELCRKHRIPLLRPPNGDINHPQFLQKLQKEFRPSTAFSCYCPQILRRDLLDIFESAINYHNGLLPGYRGLRATAWSMYRGETETGFTFHYMTERIDAGRILLQNSIPITSETSYRELEVKKALLARSQLARVLTMIFAGEKGIEPKGTGAYFSRKAWRTLTTIREPRQLSASELQHRLSCFEILSIRIGHRYYPVTAVIEGGTKGKLSFQTEDGVQLTPVRFLYLPYPLYLLCQLTRKCE
jgi:folate-dependent phosphoribosylglycinamide formyltransferase PurN